MIEVRCFNSFIAAASLREQINALNVQSVRPDPFSTFEFLDSFYQHDEYHPSGHGLRLWLLTAFQANRLVGYVALKQTMHTVFGLRKTVLGFLVTHDTDRPHLVADRELAAEVSAAIYQYIFDRKQEWSELVWLQQDTAVLVPPPNALLDQRVREWPSMENCTIQIRWDTLAAYFGALTKKFRSDVARQMRHLLTERNVEWLSSSDVRITPLLFDLYLSIEPRSWKAQASAHIGRSPARIAYVRKLLEADQPMRVSIQVILLDGVPIAGLICGAFLQGLYALHIVYDVTQSRFSPGTAMLLLGVRQAIEGRYAFFNLLSGFKYYKSRWLATITETRIVQIYRAGSLAYWHRVLGDCKRWLFSRAFIPAHFNPARRNARDREALLGEARALHDPLSGRREHEHIAALVAEIRGSGCEYLSTVQLAAAMPFDICLSVRQRTESASAS